MELNEFKVGIQLHIKISNKKLFCRCDQNYSETNLTYDLTTYNVDRDMLYTHKYHYDLRNCDYELQNSLPLVPLKSHFAIAKSVSRDLNFKILEQYHVERKHILDGSLPSGFQRTGLIGLNGSLEGIKLTQIRLEQDSCKKQKTGYNTTRLGIPLLEIVSEPITLTLKDITKLKTFLIKLAEIVRKYTTVRGIGTIRQDLNISAGLGKTELKGFQDLHNIQKVVSIQLNRVRELACRFYSYTVQENHIRLDLYNEFCKKTIKEVIVYLLNCTILQQSTNFFKFEIPLNYRHSIVLDVLNAFRFSVFETVRRVDKQGESHFLRYRQTKQRYHPEPLLRVVNLHKINFKLPEKTLQVSSLYKEIKAQLKISIKPELISQLETKYQQGVYSKPQLTCIIRGLNEGLNYETITDPDSLKPFNIQFIQNEDLTQYANFNQFLYCINKKYRSNISDYLQFKDILEDYWKTKTK